MNKIYIGFFFFFLSISCAKASITEDEAVNIITNLPAFQKFHDNILKIDPEIKVIIRPEMPDSKNEYYEFYVGEDHETHTVAWNLFAIHKKTGKILIFDILNAEFIPLEKCARIEARCIK